MDRAPGQSRVGDKGSNRRNSIGDKIKSALAIALPVAVSAYAGHYIYKHAFSGNNFGDQVSRVEGYDRTAPGLTIAQQRQVQRYERNEFNNDIFPTAPVVASTVPTRWGRYVREAHDYGSNPQHRIDRDR